MDSFVSGNWLKQKEYRSFAPSPINRSWKIADARILEALSRADRQLGRLDMFSSPSVGVMAIV